MPSSDEPVWRALASPIRREIMDLLRDAPLSTSDVVVAFPDLSRFAVMQHLGVLEEAGLVVPHRLGRVRMNCLNPVPLRLITQRWISRFDEEVSDSLIDLKSRLEAPGTAVSPKPAETKSPRTRRSIPGAPSRISFAKPKRKPRHA